MEDDNYASVLSNTIRNTQASIEKICKIAASAYTPVQQTIKAINNIFSSLKPYYEKMRKIAAEVAVASRPLVALNIMTENQIVYWDKLPQEFVEGIIDAKKINAYLLSWYRKENFKKVEETIDNSINSSILKPYLKLYIQAIDAYRQKNNDLALLGFSAIIDGLLTDVSGNPTHSMIKRVNELINKIENDIDLDVIESSSFILIYTIEPMMESFASYAPFDQPEPKTLNRNWLMHGRSHRRRSKLDCIKLINFIYGLILLDELNNCAIDYNCNHTAVSLQVDESQANSSNLK